MPIFKYCSALIALFVSVFSYAQGMSPGLKIEQAWVRAMPPSQSSTAAYMTVINQGETSLVIVGARSDTTAIVEIHRTLEVDGMSRMERVERVAIDSGETLEISPGGMHLMIMGLEAMPAAGEHLRLCLELESGESVCAQAQVRRVAPSGNKHHH